MGKLFLRKLGVCVLLCAFAVAVAGCWNPFAPDGGGGGPPDQVQYKVRSSCENVLYNLSTGYIYMNADEYLDCLAEEFVFYLNPDDWGNPQNDLPELWEKQEEEAIHRNMFADGSDVDGINLTLTNIQIAHDPGEDPEDPSDDRWEYQEGVDLRVRTPPDLTYLATADQLFIFQIDPNEIGPDDETLYEVIEWHDLQPTCARPVPPGPGEELISFGRLKAMYRQ